MIPQRKCTYSPVVRMTWLFLRTTLSGKHDERFGCSHYSTQTVSTFTYVALATRSKMSLRDANIKTS